MKDKVQELQRRNLVMPKYAPDQDEPQNEQVGWEEFSSQPVVPRRASWRTPGQDDFDLLAQVSESKVPVTSGTSASLSMTRVGLSESEVLAILERPEVVAAITAEVIKQLPIVDFECPE
jgi:hypothetical protein